MTSTGRMRVGVMFGGRSAEHEVSIVSASGIIGAMDRERFEAVPLGVTLGGALLTPEESRRALEAAAKGEIRALTEPAGEGILSRPRALTALSGVDVVFPLIHGTNGEDGTLQGFLELARLPYVGAGLEASAIGLDKARMKAAFREAGLPMTDHIVLTWNEVQADPAAAERAIAGAIGFPAFVKPANGGSSVGITKVRSSEDLHEALASAARYDDTLVVERAVSNPREIECSVLGNDTPMPSVPGEIIPDREFYDYDAKYGAASCTRLVIPADLDGSTTAEVQRMSVAAFRAIACAGMGRVDFLLSPDEGLLVSEINTIPGFTPISMYPKLWEASGIPYRDLITRLIELGIERHERREQHAEAYANRT